MKGSTSSHTNDDTVSGSSASAVSLNVRSDHTRSSTFAADDEREYTGKWWQVPPSKPSTSKLRPHKWHKQAPVSHHRYVNVALTIDTDPSNPSQAGPNPRTIPPYQCVAFWPFVGPKSFPETAEWENCVAVCGQNRVLVASISEENPWTVMYEFAVQNDELYTLAWSLNPYDMHPVIAAGGRSGLIYLFDVQEQSMFRILTGHGESILGLDFSPTSPHILASASADKTTRIWNILGANAAEPAPGDYNSQNYPMGMADEGEVLVAILAGEGGSGHRAKVVGVAFHPTKNAVATCGEDYYVKIWALPAFPDPIPAQEASPKGYRANLISFSIFSTNLIHSDNVDCIAWLSDDVLISRGVDDIITWRWLSLDRFFLPRHAVAEKNMVIKDDYDRSRSFQIIAKYNFRSLLGGHDIWYHRFGIHHAFVPDPSDPHWLVDGTLLAIGDIASAYPAVLLFNPLMAEDGPPPLCPTELRPPLTGDSDSEEEYNTLHLSSVNGSPAGPAICPKETLAQRRKAERSLNPWQLQPLGHVAATHQSPSLNGYTGMVRHAAISPRGAQWIVGVGEGQSIFVYQLKPDR